MTSDELVPASSSAAVPATTDALRPLVAPVHSVVVLEDRAHVTRRGSIELPMGVARLSLGDVSPVIVDKTLRATLTSSDPASNSASRVFDVRARRTLRTLRSESPEEVAKIESALAEVDKSLQSLADERTRLESRLEQFAQAQRLFWAETAADVAYNRSPSESALAEAKQVAELERVARSRLVDLRFEEEAAQQRGDDLAAQLEHAASPGTEWAGTIEIDLEVAAAGVYEAAIDYLVPNACWRPSHVARLGPDGKLFFASSATVWQNTGEAWSGVELACSTDRPSLGVEPPELTSDVLSVRKKPVAVEVESRDQIVQTIGLGADEALTPASSDSRVPGVDDNGEPQHLKIVGRATVPSDGRPHRLPLFDFETETQTETLVAAELIDAAIVKTTQTNRAAHPLLAGPVDLIRDGGLIGRTVLRFIAPKEVYALGWGPDPDVRVQRDEEVVRPEPKLLSLSSWITTTHHVKVRLSNVGPAVKTLTIRERVPISEIEKVQIVFDQHRTTGKLRPDADGFVTWTITLAPFGRSMVELWYEIKKSKDVVGAP